MATQVTTVTVQKLAAAARFRDSRQADADNQGERKWARRDVNRTEVESRYRTVACSFCDSSRFK